MAKPKSTGWRRFGRRDGQVLPLMAIGIPVLIGMAGISITVGTLYFGEAKLQNAVDAAALAGAQEMATGDPNAPGDQASLITLDDPISTQPSVVTQAHTVVATATANIPGSFAALFGHKYFTIHARAVAQYGPGAAFNYAVFQGTTSPKPPLTFNGNDTVNGNVHSNTNITLRGSNTITGVVNAVGTISDDGSNSTGSLQSNQPDITMPQWSMPAPPSVSSAATTTSITLNGGQTLNGNWIVSGNVVINGSDNTINGSIETIDGGSITINGSNNVINGSLLATGGAGGIAVNGGSNTITGSVYTEGGGSITYGGNDTVDGATEIVNTTSTAATITLNGDVSGGPVLVEGGSITLNGNDSANNGSGLVTAAFTNSANVGGDITVNGNISLTGVAYAPNGTITLNGNDTVNGEVVGDYVVNNGNNTVTWDNSTLTNLPSAGVALIQ